MENNNFPLTNREYSECMDLIVQCMESLNESSVVNALNWAQNVTNFESAAVGVVNIDTSGSLIIDRILNHSCNGEWLDYYILKNYANIDPVVHYALSSKMPFFWTTAYTKCKPKSDDLQNAAKKFGINKNSDGIAYGSGKSHKGRKMTLTSIAYVNSDHRRKTAYIVDILTPIFHNILSANKQTKKALPKNTKASLTKKELEVLKWSMLGKSSWEIGCILSSSERTVKFHFLNIYQKLNVSNRAHAIAQAIQLGLIH